MKSIIFFETYKSGSSREGIIAAKNLGFKVHLLTSNKRFLDEKDEFIEIDEFHFVDFYELDHIRETIVQIQKNEHVACVISFIDSYVYLAASFSNELCGTNLSVNAFKVMEDKLLTRNQLQGQPYSPFFDILPSEASLRPFIKNAKDRLPLILKLPKSCGSKHVYLIETRAQLRNRIHFLRTRFDDDLLIEEYLSGPQVIVEAIVHQGNIQIATIVEQEITKSQKFIITGYSISSNELENTYKDSLIKTAHEIIQTFGLENGNCHLEMRHVQNAWKLIEANPRISGGVMNDLIQEAYGFNYVEQILNVYLGNSPTLHRTKEESVYAHYLTVDEHGELIKVNGKQKALEHNGVLKVFIKPKKGKILSPPLSMGDRYGYILAKGNTKNEAKMNAIDAASQIKFHITPLIHQQVEGT
ncbi:ATP-grasp domain-containing protein [Ureibacillus sp. NPDC094379]